VDEHGKKTYVGLNRLDPHVYPFLLAADFQQIYHELVPSGELDTAHMDQAATAMALAFKEVFMSRSYMQGFREAAEFLTSKTFREQEAGTKFLRKTAARIAVPTGVAAIAQEIDPVMREAEGFLDTLYARIPWGGKADAEGNPVKSHLGQKELTLYPKRKLNGDPIMRLPSLGPDWASPLPYTKGKPDPVSREIINNEVSLSPAPKVFEGPKPIAGMEEGAGRIPGVVLTPKQYDRFVRLAGNDLKMDWDDLAPALEALGYDAPLPRGKAGMWDLLTHLVQAPGWKKLTEGPDGQRADIIRHVVAGFRRAARYELFTTDAAYKEKVVETKWKRGAAMGGAMFTREHPTPASLMDLVESIGR
jgi:hypothetical protein